ncbi:MAG: hypothetical protein Q8R18_04330, partial [bacterium]|nr:hypothetical protein [bacterium]
MADENLVSLLRERLPESYDLNQQTALVKNIGKDIATIRETYEENVGSYAYSDSPGPFEVNIDFGGLEDTLNYIGGMISDGNYTLEEIQELQRKANFTLENIQHLHEEGNEELRKIGDNTEELYDIAESLGNLESIAEFGVGIASLSLGVQTSLLGETEEIHDELRLQTFLLRSISGSLEWGFDTLDESLADIHYEQKKHRMILKGIHTQLNILNQGQEQRHKELIDVVTDLAHRPFNLKAREKFRMAEEQFSVKNYSLALREVRVALGEDSTHSPSLLLLGRISTQYGQWKIAKNSYYEASRLALKRKDKDTFEVAILGISDLEILLGNSQ